MSIVVGVKRENRLVLASDSRVVFGEGAYVDDRNAVLHKTRRIGPRGDTIIGTTGWGVYENILDDFIAGREELELGSGAAIFAFFLDLWKALHDRYPFVNDQSNDKDSPFGNLDTTFLIGSPGGLFMVSTDLAVTHFKRYCAIGSGADYALGALKIMEETEQDPRVTARRAVEAAIALDSGCGGTIEVHEVEATRSGEA